MKKVIHLFLLAITLIFSSFILLSCVKNENTENTYTITWKNDDGIVIKTDNLKKGEMPKYEGITPYKKSDMTYNYTFNGWDKEIKTVEEDIVYSAVFEKEYINYTITFLMPTLEGFEIIFKKDDYHYGDKIIEPEMPIQDNQVDKNYEFNGWDKEIKNVDGNDTYYATFKGINRKYNVTFKDEDESILLDTKEYDYNTPKSNIVLPDEPKKENTKEYTYEFIGYDKTISDVLCDITYTAVYKAIKNKYKITFKDEDDTILKEESYEYGTKASDIDIPSPKKDSTNEFNYEFKGWDNEISDVTDDATYKAVYEESYVEYDVKLKSNIEGACTFIGAGKYHFNDNVDISFTINPGYTFVGWYINNELYTNFSSFEYNVDSSIEFEAVFESNLYKLTISNPNNLDYSGVISGNEYLYNANLTISTTDTTSKYIVWYVDDEFKYYGLSYSFVMPNKDITVRLMKTDTLENLLYTKEDNKIYFGTYPQTKVEDDTLINSLNEMAGELPSIDNLYNWTDYNYYDYKKISSYMYYQDIDINDDNIYDYRGVYFTKYRPYSVIWASSNGNTHQDENHYEINTVYWFKYEAIEWNILKEADGKALIISNLILDAQEIYPYYTNYEFEHNGAMGYDNNYELSNIRIWLNNKFYDEVFNDLAKTIINITKVDNSAKSTGNNKNEYACNNTSDKIFLLSNEEAYGYFASSNARLTTSTDYTKCQGLYVFSNGSSGWFLRSPGSTAVNTLMIYLNGDSANASCYDCMGIRPACWINL